LRVADVGLLGAAAQTSAIGRSTRDHALDEHTGNRCETHLRGQIGAMANETMPIEGRLTRPNFNRSASTALAVLMGMANPMPELWSAPFEAIMVLMPMTSPLEFSSGPPELPGLMAASV